MQKIVVNDDGTAVPGDWTLTATGPDTVTGPGNSADVTEQTVTPGDYTLTESGGPPGYDPGTWQCTGGTVTDDVVTITDDATVVCTITNTEIVIPPPDPDPGPVDPGDVGGESETLPGTGSDPLAAAGLGFALLLGGIFMLAIHRRRVVVG